MSEFRSVLAEQCGPVVKVLGKFGVAGPSESRELLEALDTWNIRLQSSNPLPASPPASWSRRWYMLSGNQSTIHPSKMVATSHALIPSMQVLANHLFEIGVCPFPTNSRT